MFGFNELKTGSLLISEPFMMDPNFKRSVIILVDYEPEGEAFGLVLNQPLHLNLDAFLVGDSKLDRPLYVGGPVEPSSLHFLHQAAQYIPNSLSIKDNLYYGGDFESILKLVEKDEISKEDIKFFAGYAGWSPGQLESEIKENTWLILNDYNAQIPLIGNEEDLWKECIIAMGPKFAHVAKFPENPFLN